MFRHEDIAFRVSIEKDLEYIRNLRNDPTTWLGLTTPGEITEEEQKEWFKRISLAKDKRYYTIIGPPGFLGIIRTDEIDRANRSIRIGVDIVPGQREKGYGTKAYEAFLGYCFDYLNMNRVWLCVLDSNFKAKKLYEKIGFQVEGRMRRAVFREGEYRDYIIMSILEDEYRANAL
jgi:RimJ/RimL family protein N-acetyltransferase